MGSSINPLTFFGASSMIEQGASLTPLTNSIDAKNAFMKMLLEKVFLNGFQSSSVLDSNNDLESSDSEFSVFDNNTGMTIVNDMFRQQISEQLIQSDVFNLDNMDGAKP